MESYDCVRPLGATLVPAIFDKIFGRTPISFKFISRSFLATTLFWLTLLEIKHPDWGSVLQNLRDNIGAVLLLLPIWYGIDYISLIKAKFLINILTFRKFTFLASLLFLLLDIVASYTLPLASLLVLNFIGNMFDKSPQSYYDIVDFYVKFTPFTQYISYSSQNITLAQVLVPSTMLTSLWTLLILVSSIVATALIPINQLRRFTAWWFRDVEKRPLTALAKVAGTLIILGAVVIKAVRWTVT